MIFSKLNKLKKSENNNYLIKLNGELISYSLELSRRRSISLTINKNAEIKIKAPNKISKKYLEDFIIKKSNWIIKKRDFFIKNQHLIHQKQEYKNGSQFKLLGENYQLFFKQNLINKIEINKLNKIIIYNFIKEPNKNKIIKNIDKFIQEFAIAYFYERLEICKIIAKKERIFFNRELKFRKMKSKWGSCSRGGEIKLSYSLIKAPEKSIDYVILHELCHLREFNHSKDFYQLLEKLMPDWQIHKNNLKNIYSDFGE
ncbi:MAG: SprT family zinc-dependent metalloprotease [Rickettsiales bacterium]|nr:SprT family zinc-dependent metalloprotease [Rickettsiales bacterium]